MKRIIYLLIVLILFGCDRITSKDATKNNNRENVLEISQGNDTLKIEKFSYSECLNNCDITSRIINQKLENKTYSLTFGAHLNCAGNFISEVVAMNDTLDFKIDLKPNKNGMIVATDCNCFYNVSCILIGVSKIPKEILINGETLKENQERNADIIEIEDTKVK